MSKKRAHSSFRKDSGYQSGKVRNRDDTKTVFKFGSLEVIQHSARTHLTPAMALASHRSEKLSAAINPVLKGLKGGDPQS